MKKRSFIGRTSLAAMLAALAALAILLSSKAGAVLLMTVLESYAVPLHSPLATNAQAIVVLGGGTQREYHAAKLQRQTGLPLLVSGIEAPNMARQITQDFATPIEWMEKKSLTTEQNGEFSTKILKQNGIQRILLVTNASHMLRASTIFRDDGFEVIAAPVTFSKPEKLSAADFMPSSEGIHHARFARHEFLGLAWFWANKVVRDVTAALT